MKYLKSPPTSCSCCRSGRPVTPGPDNESNLCVKCKDEQGELNEREWLQATELVMEALCPANQEKFLSMEKPLQRGTILQMIEDQIIYYPWRGHKINSTGG